MKRPVIALLTDFGGEDFFVASMKGVILGINPEVNLVDVSHRVPSFGVEEAAFRLWASYRFFPEGTIFVTVVDPGVGSQREVLLAATQSNYYFIAPDNGVLTRVLKDDPPRTVRYLQEKSYFLLEVSRTFEGRDRMAPVAAQLTLGIPCEKFGPECVSYNELELPEARSRGGRISGAVAYIDKFGNAITNIPARLLDTLAKDRREGLMCRIGDRRLPFRESYAAGDRGAPLFLIGSLGLLEVAVREGSAARELGLKGGEPVRVAAKDDEE
jgi:S-adenosylmethionine hydrolase